MAAGRPGAALAQGQDEGAGDGENGGDPSAAPPPASQPTDQPAPEEPAHKRAVALGAEVEVIYTSNVFHEQNRRLDNFGSDAGPGERFEGMEGPADIYARPTLEIGWAHKVAPGRRLKLSAGADYTAHMRNSIANYFTLEAEGVHDFTKRDRLALEIEFIPHRFKENYFNDVGGNKVFDKAIYTQVTPTLAYRREWAKRWSTELEYELALRRFQDPFPHRDGNIHTASLLLAWQPTHRATVKLGPELGFTQVDQHMEFGAEVDRSHRDVGLLGEIDLAPGHHWDADLELEFERKSYGSDDPLDDSHYQRIDDVVEAELEVEKRLSHTWYLTGVAGFTAVRSNRDDPDLEPDEAGYTEVVLGAGGAAKF